MDGVKKAFGVALLATAWSLLAPVLPPAFYLGGWAVLCIVTAIWLRAIDPLPVHAPGGCACSKAWPSSCCWWGACSWSVLFRGASDPWRPLAGLRATEKAAPKLPFERVRTLAELEARISAAGRPVLVDYYADWCVACKDMERSTFADDQVRQRLARLDLAAGRRDEQQRRRQSCLPVSVCSVRQGSCFSMRVGSKYPMCGSSASERRRLSADPGAGCALTLS